MLLAAKVVLWQSAYWANPYGAWSLETDESASIGRK
jgi:hypothetical protein